ncbi:MAG TPA: tryptophan 7-halogenase [Pyrinomonadaceae bacterium]|nr:tryptophan 7-halogenase [Pyrinomonadaceae bacterium]
MRASAEDFDVVVIGGGPGGSTASTVLAMQNHRVLLLEREKFPRYQIGESLLPATIHGVCKILGLSEELKKAGFVRKLGGTFRWGTNPEPWTFAFSTAASISAPKAYAYQVERAKFDHLLLKNAAHKGVDVREGHSVRGLLFEDGRACGVEFADADGNVGTAAARYVVDASGHQSRVYQHVGERIYSNFFQNLALFGYYENGGRFPPPRDGNIFCAAFKEGWFWYIPLSDKLTSVGAVVSKEYADQLKGGYEEAMKHFIDSCPEISRLLANATRVTEGVYGQLRVRKDWSYTNERFWSPGILLVGDAACFIDPVFSSGVHLATYSGLLAARSINSVLNDGMDETRCFEEFEKRYRREFRNFYEFLTSFYDMHQREDSYFWRARKILRDGASSEEAFVTLVAGVSNLQRDEELLVDSVQVERIKEKLRQLEDAEDDAAAPYFASEKGSFLDALVEEATQLQTQASAGVKRGEEQPLFDGGLIPSADGLRWREVPAGAAAGD